MSRDSKLDALRPSDDFPPRHIGPRSGDVEAMLEFLGYGDIDTLVQDTIPDDILMKQPLDVPEAKGEFALIRELRELASKNKVYQSFIGLGYHDCITPPVIQRNILENPNVSLVIDDYSEEWSKLAYVLIRGTATLLEDGEERDLAESILRDKYPQYELMLEPGCTVLKISIERVTSWGSI